MLQFFRKPILSLLGAGLIMFVSCQTPQSNEEPIAQADTQVVANMIDAFGTFNTAKSQFEFPFEIRDYSSAHHEMSSQIAQAAVGETPLEGIENIQRFRSKIHDSSMPLNDKEDLLTKIEIMSQIYDKLERGDFAKNRTTSAAKLSAGAACALSIGAMSTALFAAQEVATLGAASLWAASWVAGSILLVDSCARYFG